MLVIDGYFRLVSGMSIFVHESFSAFGKIARG